MKVVDKDGDCLSYLCDSLRHTTGAAMDAMCEPSTKRPPEHGGTITPASDGQRYWFGIARGVRRAKQLLIDLKDETHVLQGWPVYWVKDGAYILLTKGTQTLTATSNT